MHTRSLTKEECSGDAQVMGKPVASVDASILEAAKDVAVLFDFDGTLGDTETPAMEVAYWELAPYFAGITAAALTEEAKVAFIRENAGKAFEHMVEVADKERKAAGLSTIAECKCVLLSLPLSLCSCGPLDLSLWCK
jgi:hypothetical protein